jgi:hypothetical protein
MTLEPLYRITFSYGEVYRAGAHTLLFAEGACEGRLAGRFRGANRARLSSTGAWIPQLEGAVVTEDGATILIELTGRGRPDADPVGHVTGMVTHKTVDERYAWLNDTVGAVVGEVYPGERVVLDVSALHWKPLPVEPGYDHGET